jgi:hypothetical protein
VPIHPELHKAIRQRGLDEDALIIEVIHRILCTEFDRLDLLMQAPDPVGAAN